MNKDKVFVGSPERASDFEFNEAVASVFDDMLSRSVPYYHEQQQLIQQVARTFHVPGTRVYDLGCSTGVTLINLARALGPDVRLIGYDYSQPMLDKAGQNIAAAGLSQQIELRRADFNDDLSTIELEQASIVTLCWTLQFVRPLKRDSLIRWINHGMVGGAFICMEKILTSNSDMNRYFIDFYYEYKARKGYSDEEIQRKREALENVLVPYRTDENCELFRRNGFNSVETCFQWFNFAGYLCVKGN